MCYSATSLQLSVPTLGIIQHSRAASQNEVWCGHCEVSTILVITQVSSGLTKITYSHI